MIIFNFSDIKRGYKIKIEELHTLVKIEEMKELRYQKNSLQLWYNSTETCDVKTRCKNN